jgi:hypothetical protein
MKTKVIFIKVLPFVFLIFVFISCIEPFRPELTKHDQESKLVVESTITDQQGPFKVRLTKTASVYSGLDTLKFDPITGAVVHISDDKENIFHYTMLKMVGMRPLINVCRVNQAIHISFI